MLDEFQLDSRELRHYIVDGEFISDLFVWVGFRHACLEGVVGESLLFIAALLSFIEDLCQESPSDHMLHCFNPLLLLLTGIVKRQLFVSNFAKSVTVLSLLLTEVQISFDRPSMYVNQATLWTHLEFLLNLHEIYFIRWMD